MSLVINEWFQRQEPIDRRTTLVPYTVGSTGSLLFGLPRAIDSMTESTWETGEVGCLVGHGSHGTGGAWLAKRLDAPWVPPDLPAGTSDPNLA